MDLMGLVGVEAIGKWGEGGCSEFGGANNTSLLRIAKLTASNTTTCSNHANTFRQCNSLISPYLY